MKRVRAFFRCARLFDIISSIKLVFLRKKMGAALIQLKKKGFGKIWIRRDATDFALLRSFYLMDIFGEDNMYDLDLEKYGIAKDSIQTIVDAGANIGLFSIKMFERYKDAKYICIEPEQNNYELLKKNTEKIGAKCYRTGLWDKCVNLNVTTTELSSGTVGYVVREQIDGEISGITIERLMEENGLDIIDILKMDIEGAEFQLFFSGEYKKWIDKVRVLIIEIHDVYSEKGTEKIRSIMEAYGFKWYVLCEDTIFIKMN